MAKSARELVDLILLGPLGDRRQVQDSPILGDVWTRFACEPAKPSDLLISPEKSLPAGAVAKLIVTSVVKRREKNPVHDYEQEKGQWVPVKSQANIAFLQGLIVARLTFREVLELLVPKSAWWHDREIAEKLREYPETSKPKAKVKEPKAKKWDAKQSLKTKREIEKALETAVLKVKEWIDLDGEPTTESSLLQYFTNLNALERYLALAGMILWAGRATTPPGKNPSQVDIIAELQAAEPKAVAAGFSELLMPLLESSADAENNQSSETGRKLAQLPAPVFDSLWERESEVKDLKRAVWQISLNRRAAPALERSVQAVKGDAASTLFKVKCDEIAWAVLDSGINVDHEAFQDGNGKTRIIKAYDFCNIRSIVSCDNLALSPAELKAKVADLGLKATESEAVEAIEYLSKRTLDGRPIDWEVASKLIVLAPKNLTSDHGSHVAGIIGARAGKNDGANGMCPDIKFYDLRVLSKSIEDTEFAIIAALQFIRHLNERNNFRRIHGANLSLSIPHDVRNFACGRTPICDECERLVENGTVVVAAAGNFGYQSFETKNGQYDGYTALSITDPGNADGVITVGSTHRFWPHTYGVSFFSSRGPTGDGRLKPDLVAPGERIRSAIRDGWSEMDGTSMAAPHVSGAAAMLMARYPELVGQPRRIKQILCDTATDLGRERTFQGHGMLDVLRAFQSI